MLLGGEMDPLIVINFSVSPDAESDFNQFYHQQFLPQLLKESPEIKSIRRYEEIGVGGTLRWYNKQYLTIYQLNSVEAISKADAIFENAAVADVVKKFRQWKDNSLRNFSRITFKHTWSHARLPVDGVFSSRPFFLWQLEMKPELDHQFQDWYEKDYLPLQIAEIPTWVSSLRYESVGREPLRRLTIFETADESTLSRSLSDLRSVHRNKQNDEWHRRVDPAVTWHDASSFRPIFRWPD
jgi:hypothetical protein